MFKPLIDSYSAVLKKFKGNDIGATINEEVNIERLKTMYDGYDGDRIIEIRFIDPRRFTAQQRNFIYLTMRVNRLELLKANIGLELIATFNELDKYFSNELTKAGLDELKRQAGILEMAIAKSGYAKLVEQVINSSFRADGFATFSERLWMYQAELKH